MLKSLLKFIFHFIVYVSIFLVLVWLLLGISPNETYEKFKKQLSFYSSHLTFISNTAEKISNAASNQLQNATDRLHGKDPYERINQQLSDSLK